MTLDGLWMAGIDHSTADVKIREQFAFTAAQAQRAMAYIKEQPGVRGCVLLSTCGRLEVWVSIQEGMERELDLPALVCRLKNMNHINQTADEYRKYFTSRQADDAARHLFYLSAGLKSQILGEDQILSQVKDAAARARAIYCTDTLLEVLFRYAVTAGKEVKTKVPVMHHDCSAAHYAIADMKQHGYVFAGKTCLVIGNGQMGRLAALALQDEGALVTVTVRQYCSGRVEIPRGCSRIDYGRRYEKIPECDLVISATASPNLTIRKEQLEQARGSCCRDQVYIDLAVPRDIEEAAAELKGIVLYDIDSFRSSGLSDGLKYRRQAAEAIISAKLAEFRDWYECRELVPRIQQIGRLAAEDICWRMGRGLHGLSQDEQEQIHRQLEESAAKAVDKLLFALRDELPREELYHCVEILEKVQEN